MRSERYSGRIIPLDGLRGLAVSVVVIHNAAWAGNRAPTLLSKVFGAVVSTGWIGVQLFFVLSGFLITNILLDSKNEPGFFRNFYIRRSLRIFPLYYVVLASTILTAFVLRESASWPRAVLENQWSYWLYLSNWMEPFGASIKVLSHVWSLAVEEQFYLVWPFVVFGLSFKRLWHLAIALLLSGPVIRYLLFAADFPVTALYSFTIARWDALAAGALLALTLRHQLYHELIVRYSSRASLVVGVGLLVVVLRQHGFHEKELPVMLVGQSLVTFASVLTVLFALRQNELQSGWAYSILAKGLLPHLGTYSYAMYLLHYPLHRALQQVFGAWVNDDRFYLARISFYCFSTLFLSYLGARVSWQVIERPFLEAKERFAPRALVDG